MEAFVASINQAELDEEQQLKRLRYKALLAERQCNRVDPDNRLIAAELERCWEVALRELLQAEEVSERRRAMQGQSDELTPAEQNEFVAAGSQLSELWQRPDIEWGRKKALLRSLIDKVILQRVVRDRITIRIVWRGGEVTEREVEPRVHSLSVLSRGADMEARLIEMAHQGLDDTEIAAKFTEEGFCSPRCSYVPVWKVPAYHSVIQILHNPLYAGAYAFGRRAQRTRIVDGRARKTTGCASRGMNAACCCARDTAFPMQHYPVTNLAPA